MTGKVWVEPSKANVTEASVIKILSFSTVHQCALWEKCAGNFNFNNTWNGVAETYIMPALVDVTLRRTQPGPWGFRMQVLYEESTVHYHRNCYSKQSSGSVNIPYGSGICGSVIVNYGSREANELQIRILPGHFCGQWKKIWCQIVYKILHFSLNRIRSRRSINYGSAGSGSVICRYFKLFCWAMSIQLATRQGTSLRQLNKQYFIFNYRIE